MRLSVVLLMSALSGCHFAYHDSATVPAQPNYEDHVLPIFEHHCLVCHGVPSDRGAPSYFTLAQYDDTNALDGAYIMAFEVGEQINQNQMPPAAQWGDGLGDNDKRTIQLWIANGAPKDASAAAINQNTTN